jgi:hypothetical protein
LFLPVTYSVIANSLIAFGVVFKNESSGKFDTYLFLKFSSWAVAK